jgi:hypothetical protein
MERIQQLLGRAKYKLAIDTDFNYKINLESKLRPLKNNLNKIISTISSEEVFRKERTDSTKYRVLGRLNIFTDNSIFIVDDNGGEPITRPTNEDWDPLFDGENTSNDSPPNEPNNWIIQLLYPYKMDKYSSLQNNQAYRGITIKSIASTNISGTKDQLIIETLQKNQIEEGDFCYIYSITHNSQYNGFHEVEFKGENGLDGDYKLRLKTNFNGNDNELLLKRIVNLSEDDINFINPINILKVTSCDISGGTTNSDYLKVNTGDLSPTYSASTHNLRIADYVDVRSENGNFNLNGLHRVVNILDRYNYVIDLKIFNTPGIEINNLGIPHRKLNGIPSDYYIRKFKLISSNDYLVSKATTFGSSIYPKTIKNDLGVANDTWLFTFINDIDTSGLYNHRGGELLELSLATIKRAGQNTFDWSNVTAHWDFQDVYAENGNKIEDVSINVPNGVGTIEKKIKKVDEYFGDFVEFNRRELKEKIVSEIIHRFALNTNPTPENGYFVKPFQQIFIRKYSNSIEEANSKEIVVGIPGDAELKPNGDTIWRDVLEPGFIEEGDNGVNYPFLNGATYIYVNKQIYVIRQTTPKEIITKTVDPLIIC